MSCMGKLHFRPGLGKMTGAGRQNGFPYFLYRQSLGFQNAIRRLVEIGLRGKK